MIKCSDGLSKIQLMLNKEFRLLNKAKSIGLSFCRAAHSLLDYVLSVLSIAETTTLFLEELSFQPFNRASEFFLGHFNKVF